jgi:ubiquinone/menaquinone biosynthesis C-methylase UbiE
MGLSLPEKPVQVFQGIPSYLGQLHPSIYSDPPDLEVYVTRYEYHRSRTSIFEKILLNNMPAGSNVLSIGEGSGEYVASLAAKFPKINFFAFDYTPERVVIAKRLADALKLDNLVFYIGSVEYMPFPKGFFSGIIERGVFHILPRELKLANIEQVEKVCHGRVVMNWMANANMYILTRWCQSKWLREKKIWEDAVVTYRMIESGCNSLKKYARLCERRTGHKVDILYTFDGDTELSEPLTGFRTLSQYMGGFTYDTRTSAQACLQW